MKRKNQLKRLAVRQADYEKLMNHRGSEIKVQMRKETGGFHKPSSTKH